MELISPEEFKKSKGKSGSSTKLISPDEFKSSSKPSTAKLISPDEFKETQSKQIQREPISETTRFLSSTMTKPVDIQQSVANLPKVEPEQQQPEQNKPRNPILNLANRLIAQGKKNIEKLASGRGGQVGSPLAPREALSIPNKDSSVLDRLKFTAKVLPRAATDPIAETGAQVYQPGAGISSIAPAYVAVGNLLRRLAPKLTNTKTGRVAEEIIKDAAVSAPIEAGYAAKTAENNADLAKQTAIGTGIGAGLGGAVSSAVELSPLVRKIFDGVKARRAGKETPEAVPQTSPDAVSAMSSTPKNKFEFNVDKEGDRYQLTTNDELSTVTGYVEGDELYIMTAFTHPSARRQGRYDFLVGKMAEQALKDNPNIKKITGTVVGDEALSARKRHPSTVISKDPHSEGYDAVTDIGDVLPKNATDVSSMAKTANGRPLLERGSADTGTVINKNVTKRSDVIADLSKSLNIPIRTGRFRQQAHGIHKTKSNVVRSKLTNDVPVIAHEVGHALDKRYRLSSAQFDSELQVLGQETSAPGYSKTQTRNEGVAEFFRLLLTDPAKAQTSAPNFYARFTQAVSKADQGALMKAQEQIRSYMDQDILNKSFSEMSVEQKDKTKLPSLSDLYTKFVDDLNPIKQMFKPLGEKGKRVFEDFWLLRGASGRAQAFLKQGRVDEAFNTIGKSFDDILKPVKANLNEFRTYIKDKRAIELDGRGIMTGSDLTVEERVRQVRLLENQFPQFRVAHRQLKEYQDSLLKELIDSGMLTADDVATFKAGNQEYVPFFRVFESEAGAGATKGGRTNTGSGAANQRNPIKRIKGSDREIVDPLESIVKNTYQYITIAERNRATRNLIDAVMAAEDLGGLVEKIPTPMQAQSFSLEELRLTLERSLPKGVDWETFKASLDTDAMVNIFKPTNVIPGKENIITVFREGKREFYQLDPDLYRAVTAADKEQMNFMVRAANMPVRILRSGIVNTLEFWFKNMFRDQFSAAINSKNGYVPYVDLFRGMYHVLGKTDTFTKFLASGGAQSMRQSLDRKYLQTDLRTILSKSLKDKSMNILKNPLEAMRALSELSEMGTRVGEFSKGISKYSSPGQVKQAAVAARDLIDFGRAGTWGREINKVSAFWNAHVQGLDKTIRVFTDKKTAGKAFVKSVAYITAPTAILYQINKEDPRYQELAQWDKDLFWHFWVGDKHFRLPIPFELGVMFKVVPERLLGYATGDDVPFRELGKTTFDAVDVIPGITALTPWIEAYSNKNFAGAPIVPRREQDILPEDQAGPYTSGVAKLIARLPGVNSNYITDETLGSPRKVDHIIRGYTGSIGQYVTQGIDKATDAAGLTSRAPRPATGLEDKPGFKAIMGKPFGGSTDSIDRFYERLDKLDEQSKRAEKRNQPFESAGELKQLQQIQKLISKVSKQIRAIQDNPDMSPKEKTEEIRRLNLMSNNFARMALGKDQLEYEDVFK